MRVSLYLGDAVVKNSQDYAFPSAALSNNQSFINWIYSNTIQTELHEDGRLQYFYNGLSPNPLNYIPLIQRQYLKSDTIKELHIDIIDYIRTILSQGYYFTTSVNEFYIPNREDYQRENFDHGIMVYGFDDDMQTLLTVGYSDKMHFEAQQVGWNDFRNAFMTTSKNAGCNSFKANGASYEMDIIWITTLLEDYLNSYDTRTRFRAEQNPNNNAKYGIKACREILFSDGRLDYRNFHLLYEHKEIMVQRLILLEKKFGIKGLVDVIEDYKGLAEKANILLMSSLKHKVAPAERLRGRMASLLESLLLDDERTTTALINRLRKVI